LIAHSALVEIERVWILCAGVRQRVFGDESGGRIELADQRGAVAGEPDIAALVLGQAVRPGERRLERVFPDSTGLRVEPAELVGELSGPPDRTVARGKRIVRARAEGWNIPHPDVGLHRAVDDSRRWPRPFGKVLDEIIGHGAPLFSGDGRVHVLHHAHDREPAIRRIADPDAVDVVAAIAGRSEPCLARTFRPFLRGVLGVSSGCTERDRDRQNSQRGPHCHPPGRPGSIQIFSRNFVALSLAIVVASVKVLPFNRY
jgi:hypothetical protein